MTVKNHQSDGRYAVSGCWTLALKASWEAGIVVAEELTAEKLATLTPEPKI